MALRFSLRGDNVKPRYANGRRSHHSFLANANLSSPVAVIAASSIGATNCFGTSLIDCHLRNADTHSEIYPAIGNFINNGTNIFSLRYRFVPNWDGNYSYDTPFLIIGDNPNSFNGGLCVYLFSDGTFNFRAREANDTGAQIFGITTSACTFVQGRAMEFMVVCDGTNVYVSCDGVEIGSKALDYPDRFLSAIVSGRMQIGPYISNYYLEEFTIWDSVESHVYSPRTAYFPCDDYGGVEYVDLAPSQVANGVAFGPGPGSEVGTLVPAPDPQFILTGAGGDYVAPDPGIVDSRYTYGPSGATQGTLEVPAATDTRLGVTTGDAVGTLKVPLISQVANGVVFDDDSVGTLDNVTNIFQEATAVGQSLEATAQAEE